MTPTDLFYSSTPLTLHEFGTLFSQCSKAFRFEGLYEYIVEYELPYIKLFEDEQPMPSDFNQDWLDILEAARKRSTPFMRVRKTPDSELTAYMAFEYQWGYKNSIAKGEEIRTISASTLYSLNVPLELDFWLFNDDICCLVYYDRAGRFLGVSKTSIKQIPFFTEVKNKLIANSSLLNLDF